MHKALYRQYRPIIFEDMIGQEHIIKTLKNQIKDGNINHAYLFCGTRGTGKTTTAKILSRAVNCEHLEDSNPCNKCGSCTSILNNSNLDVVEIDAASNNSVDDIRELRETVKYTPSNSKYKVYIIDEVHMLSQGAFNALLKTLEEPPSYVIFVLATTEPNKIPATILSRCQRFDFKRVSIHDLMQKMKDICASENIKTDEDSLRIIARNGQGSVRDSLSILDKCISFSNDELSSKNVEEILGISDPIQLIDFAKNIIEYNIGNCMKLIDDYYGWGKDLKILAQDLIQLFRNIMMAKIMGNLDKFDEFTSEYKDSIIILSKSIEKEEIIRILGLFSELVNNMKYSTNKRMSMEIYMMKIASPSVDSSNESIYSRIEKIEKMIEDGKINIVQNISNNLELEEIVSELKNKGLINNINSTNSDTSINKVLNDKNINIDNQIVSSSEKNNMDFIDDDGLDDIKDGWSGLMNQLNKDGKKVIRAFLLEKVDIRYKNNVLYIIGSDNFSFVIDRLRSDENLEYLKEAIKKVFGINVLVKIVLAKELSELDFDNDLELGANVTENSSNDLISVIENTFSGEIEYED